MSTYKKKKANKKTFRYLLDKSKWFSREIRIIFMEIIVPYAKETNLHFGIEFETFISGSSKFQVPCYAAKIRPGFDFGKFIISHYWFIYTL